MQGPRGAAGTKRGAGKEEGREGELHPEIIAGYQAAGAMAQAPGSGDDRQQRWFEKVEDEDTEPDAKEEEKVE